MLRITFSTLLLVFFLIFPAGARLQVMFSPASGFLRVEGSIIIEPAFSQVSFFLFPQAQITSLRAEKLLEYHIEASLEKTKVSLTLFDNPQPLTLALAYEGFLQGLTAPLQLNEDLLWFPKLQIPIQAPLIQLQLPDGWEVEIPSAAGPLQRSGQLFSWRSQGYPQLSIHPKKKEGGWLEKVEAWLAAFNQGLAARDEAGLRAFLVPGLDKKGLASYLAELPAQYGQVTSELTSWGENLQEPLTIIFKTEKGPPFQATLSLNTQTDVWKISAFSLSPVKPQLTPELQASLEKFVHQLRQAVQARNIYFMEAAIRGEQKDEIAHFLLSLNPTNPWVLKHLTLEPLSITLLVPHSPTTSLLLKLQLHLGEENWQIKTLNVIFPEPA